MAGYQWGKNNKIINKEQKCYNKNNMKKTIKVVHWNAGLTHCIRKVHTIKAMLLDTKPDITIVSEAKIFRENEEHEILIPGYKMVLLNTMDTQGFCRLAVLLKEDIQIKILTEFMDTEIASVWMKVVRRGSRKLHIGAMYRQQHLLKQSTPNASGGVENQRNRWQKFLKQWRLAGE